MAAPTLLKTNALKLSPLKTGAPTLLLSINPIEDAEAVFQTVGATHGTDAAGIKNLAIGEAVMEAVVATTANHRPEEAPKDAALMVTFINEGVARSMSESLDEGYASDYAAALAVVLDGEATKETFEIWRHAADL